MEFDQVLKERCATRKFSGQKIDSSILNKILEAGNLAPTAKNLQPFKIYVVTSMEGIQAIDSASSCRYGAPCVLLVCGDKDSAFCKGDFSTYEMDACIVATHMMLAATNLGVDNIWVEMFDADVLRQAFSIPTSLEPVCLLPMGYRSEDCPLSPNHLKRKELDDVVLYV